MGFIEKIIEDGWLKTESIKKAFEKIKREDFVTENLKSLVELNEALPIGFEQTISQPAVVAFMLEQLQPKEGEKILDIGAGSGWTTALLSEIVGEKGRVIALEIVPELKELGEKNVSKYGFIERNIATFVETDGSKGFLAEAPYNKILVSAACEAIPEVWKDQLKVGGKIVAPVGTSIKTILKKSATKFEELDHPGFVFVPLIQK